MVEEASTAAELQELAAVSLSQCPSYCFTDFWANSNWSNEVQSGLPRFVCSAVAESVPLCRRWVRALTPASSVLANRTSAGDIRPAGCGDIGEPHQRGPYSGTGRPRDDARVQVRGGRGPDQLRFATGRMAEGESNPLSHLGVPPLFRAPH